MRYINHNDNPNTRCIDNGTMIATRYIFCGEELLEDYNQYSQYEYCVKFLKEKTEIM